MIIGICEIKLYIGESFSLKDKRRVIKSIISKIKNKFNVSIAEIGDNDNWKKCVLGITCVSNEAAHADSMMATVVDYIASDIRTELMDYNTEILHVNKTSFGGL